MHSVWTPRPRKERQRRVLDLLGLVGKIFDEEGDRRVFIPILCSTSLSRRVAEDHFGAKRRRAIFGCRFLRSSIYWFGRQDFL